MSRMLSAEEQVRRAFGRWLKSKRFDAGFDTADEAAKAAGVSRVTWARYESGATVPTRDNMRAIAQAVRVSVEDVYRRVIPLDDPEYAGVPQVTAQAIRRWRLTCLAHENILIASLIGGNSVGVIRRHYLRPDLEKMRAVMAKTMDGEPARPLRSKKLV